MLRRTLMAVAMLTALGTALPASAQPRSQGDVVVSYHQMMEMADKNKDGMLTKKEFLDAMAMVFDKNMQMMKADPAMVKGEMLSAQAIRKLFMELYPGN